MDDERRRRVEQRAHAIWEEQGQPHGRHADHWRQAEQEIGDDGDDAGAGPTEASGEDLVGPDAPVAQPVAGGTGGMGSDAGLAGGLPAGGDTITGGAVGVDVAGTAATGGARALRGGPQNGAVDTGGSELGSKRDLD